MPPANPPTKPRKGGRRSEVQAQDLDGYTALVAAVIRQALSDVRRQTRATHPGPHYSQMEPTESDKADAYDFLRDADRLALFVEACGIDPTPIQWQVQRVLGEDEG